MLKKIIIFILCIFSLTMFINTTFAGAITIPSDKIDKVSIGKTSGTDIVSSVESVGFSLLGTAKIILIGVFVAYMVYAGVKMIMSMGADDEKIKSSKRHIWYALIGIVFVNVPGTIYEAFYKDSNGSLGSPTGASWISKTPLWSDTVILNGSNFGYLINSIIWLLEIVILFGAIFMITYTGIKLILGGKDTKVVSESKMKILYSVIALVFVGFIEAWKNFAFSGDISEGIGIFKTLANLVLFLAGPIAIFFLSMAGYYYITSAGNEEKVKKAKSIILYVLLGTLIFLATYTILLELGTFNV